MTTTTTLIGMDVTAGTPRGRIFGMLDAVDWSPTTREWTATIEPDGGGRLECVPLASVTPLAEWVQGS
jgi:hypothetical protein